MSLRARVDELDIGPNSGLRSKSLTGIVTQDLTAIVAVTGLTEQANWTALTVTGRRIFPQTPCVWIDQSGTFGGYVAGQIRFRVIGYNRFGEQIRTVTPWGSFTAIDFNYFYLAEAFHVVTSVEFQCSAPGLDPASTISMGVFPNFQRTEDGSNHYVWGDNQGIGLPLPPGLLPRSKLTTPPYDPLLSPGANAAAGTYTPEARFDVLALNVFNHTTGVIWRTQDNIVVGRVASGFPPEPNKVTILAFGSVTNEQTGGAVPYAFTNALQIGIVMHTSKTRIAGQRLNDLPTAY